MKILITGGSGFIGGALVDALAAQHAITVLDPVPPVRADVRHVCGTIDDRDALVDAVAGCDTIMHCAATLGVVACQGDEASVLRTNVQGTRNVLEIAARHPIRRLLFTSSSEVYGDGIAPVFSEEHTPTPKTPYGRSKLVGEEMVRDYARSAGVPCTAVRLFNAYGPRQRSDFVVARFCGHALQGRSIEVFGDGLQTRTFTYVDDAVRGALAALLNADDRKNLFEVYNVASYDTITLGELAARIVAIAGGSSPVTHRSLHEAGVGRKAHLEIRHRSANISKLVAATYYVPRISLDEGIRRTLQWHSAQVKGRYAANQAPAGISSALTA